MSVNDPKPPEFITGMSVLALLAGALYGSVGVALVVGSSLDGLPSREIISASAGLLFLSAARLTTGSALRRMRPWARLAEIAISWLWIALFVASCLDLNQEPFPLAVPLAIPALVSISKLLYLRRPEIKALFVSGGEPSQSRLQWRLSVTAGVVVFAALAALYFAPNIRTAMSRSHERTAKSEMRSVSAAVEKYAADHNGYPAGDSIQALKGLLEPKYIRTLPQRDPWTTEYRYARRVNANGTVSYRLMSAGRDGQWEENDVWKYVPGETASFDSDIVLEDGVFIRYRGGM